MAQPDKDVKDIIARLKKLDAKVANKLATKALRKAFKPTLKAARENAPVDTGQLRKSTKIYKKRTNKSRVGFMVSSYLEYGWIIEYGTSTQEPYPWMRMAYQATEQQVIDSAKALLTDAIEKEVEK